jgi:hypothetical protein
MISRWLIERNAGLIGNKILENVKTGQEFDLFLLENAITRTYVFSF